MTDFILQLEREVNETKKIVRYCCKENGKEKKMFSRSSLLLLIFVKKKKYGNGK